ncbi:MULTISPECIES: hypothetical protein [unclassified Duganella]|uniref:hypothetical protein n=1 Tax=unclassified Duganella TaxID=2636909 RepID=UPI0008866ADB|nr:MULTISPECIES: hypothetical protein [unclassified Duganella]SDH32672.1 hypothetical protein SAMN05216320_11248 [Duganella sp. OV458]SDK49399.1 hypothetical protein SAMN05428973_11248 [Duganella sp. OV510]
MSNDDDDYPDPSPEELGIGALFEEAPEPFLDLVAPPPDAMEELLPLMPQRTAAPQTWIVTVNDAKFHWYDLIAGFPSVPDIRDPVGRHLRRMQFDLEATSEKRLIYFAVNRPRVRFDTSRSTSWGFFSLKLTVPLLVGIEEKKESLTIELTVPFAATLKKPSVVLSDQFITFNWGGLIEALSIHDVLQQYDNPYQFSTEVQYVGQTRDPLGRLARARVTGVQRVHQRHSEDRDMLLLIQRMNVEVMSADGDPAELEVNQNPVAADMLLKDRIDVVECALIRYFEGPEMHGRSDKEAEVRRQRVREVALSNKLDSFRIDLRLEDANNYHDLYSRHTSISRSHIIDCTIDDGNIIVERVPVPEKSKP